MCEERGCAVGGHVEGGAQVGLGGGLVKGQLEGGVGRQDEFLGVELVGLLPIHACLKII